MKKLIPLLFALAACSQKPAVETIGSIEKLDPQLDEVLAADAAVEVIGKGFDWSEGPVWIPASNMLLFSDVPQNIVYKWTAEKGVEKYLTPSGFTGDSTRSLERGSNGLLLDKQGRLILCQHGDRRLAFLDASFENPTPSYGTVADNWQGKRFNSPNDVAQGQDGSFYMTDPPYGLGSRDETDPEKEIPFQGVYKIGTDGKARVLVDTITRPNGIALSPDNKVLYVANSDPGKARWYRYELGDTSVLSGRVFFDATDRTATENGLPDGFKVYPNGFLFASGPGGVYIFNPDGKLLGRILLPAPCANTAFGEDGKTLFVTNDSLLLKVRLK